MYEVFVDACHWFDGQKERHIEEKEEKELRYISIDDDEFPIEPFERAKKSSDKWLVHIADKNEWNSQLGEYSPLSPTGGKQKEVEVFDLVRLGNHVRSKIFTKTMASRHRALMFGISNTTKDPDFHKVRDPEHILVFIRADTDGIEWRPPLEYPFLNRPLDRNKDEYAIFALKFDIEKLAPFIPDDETIEIKLTYQGVCRNTQKYEDSK